MNTGLRITAFAAALAAAFGLAYGVGGEVGEISPESGGTAHEGHASIPPDGGGGTAAPGGLQVSERGYSST
ncbi:hypothetical protein ACE1SV_60990 [Streptomyces sp. E-15]